MGLFKRFYGESTSTSQAHDERRKKSLFDFVVPKKSRVSEATLQVSFLRGTVELLVSYTTNRMKN